MRRLVKRVLRRLLLGCVAALPGLAWPPQSGTGRSDVVQADDQPRKVRFTVDEGTWMSLDVSPDGETIVFDLLGDLYTLPVKGGMAQPLTAGPDWDIQPRFSPDGRHIAFVSDRGGVDNLWLVDRRGENARPVSFLPYNVLDSPIASPAWSSDGRTIVVSQRLGAPRLSPILGPVFEHPWRWLLAAYDIETGAMRWISDTAASTARMALGPAAAPNDAVVYAAVEPPGWAGGQFFAWRIDRIDLASGATTPEISPQLGRVGVRPAVSRDGKFLAYLTPSGSRLGLRLRDLRSGRERWLAVDRTDLPPLMNRGWGGSTADLAPGYAFTPESRGLVIALGGKIYRIDIASGRQTRIPFLVNVERTLAPMTLHQSSLPDTAVRTRAVMQAALSPDGRQVAFSVLNRIWLMALPRGGAPVEAPRRLTSDTCGEFYPSWSPDGRWIVYSAWQDGEGGAIRRARTDLVGHSVPARSDRVSLDTALYFNTAVAPDGEVIGIRAELPPSRLVGHFDAMPVSASVVTLPMTGGMPQTIRALATSDVLSTVSEAMNRWPTEQLYFTDDASRIHIGLASMMRDGSDWRRDLPISDSLTESRIFNDVTGVLAPDRRRALLTHMWTLSEVTVAGGDAVPLNVEEAQQRPLGAEAGAGHRWGRALAPWISWSRDGSRVLFVQGGTFFVGAVAADSWTEFKRVDVPLQIAPDMARGTLVLRGARLITMRQRPGREGAFLGVVPHGDVVIHDSHIASVGGVGTVPIPPGAVIFDVTGKTILPGYVDTHDHLGPPYGIHPQQWWGGLVRLAHGVTALRDPYSLPAEYNDIFSYRERERAGDLLAPRIFSTGIAHMGQDRAIRSMNEARALVYPTAEFFDAESFKEYSQEPRASRRLIAAAAREAGLNATIHGDPLLAIVDGYSGVEHNLPMPLAADVIRLIAASGATQTNTFSVTAGAMGVDISTGDEPWSFPAMRRFVPPAVRSAKSMQWRAAVSLFGRPEPDYLYPLLRGAKAVAASGGRIGIGMHGNIPGIGYHFEMWLHALGGMSNGEILRSATLVGASAIGHAQDLGSLEAGKLADLQVLERNPLDDIRNTNSLRYVMKNGRLYQATDLSELWPTPRSLPSRYLAADESAGR